MFSSTRQSVVGQRFLENTMIDVMSEKGGGGMNE